MVGLAGGFLSGAASALAQAGASAALNLTLDEMIGQMLVLGCWGSDPSAPGVQALQAWLQKGEIGGVIFFEDNLPSPAAAQRLTTLFREAAKPVLPFLLVDQEGGVVSRLRADRGFEPLPESRLMAATSPRAAALMYGRTAQELHRLGINVNLGPVVDLNLNTRSNIIAGLGRSFGSDPAAVVEFAKSFISSHHKNNVLTAIKHFPGHGSTRQDSHVSLPDISSVWRKQELQPFAELINAGMADMVMVGHLVHRDLTGGSLPATLSPIAIKGLLRSKLGYDGVTVSDDMQMGALRNNFSPEEAIVLGVEAGLDLFIYSNREHADPQMPQLFTRVIRAAIEAGRFTPERIEVSARRIIALKNKLLHKEI